jgi:hypothetical protein
MAGVAGREPSNGFQALRLRAFGCGEESETERARETNSDVAKKQGGSVDPAAAEAERSWSLRVSESPFRAASFVQPDSPDSPER